jgi:hypothetical protein
MIKHMLLSLLLLGAVVSANPLLTPESDLLGIPGVERLSLDWLLAVTDSADYGFIQPMDITACTAEPCHWSDWVVYYVGLDLR